MRISSCKKTHFNLLLNHHRRNLNKPQKDKAFDQKIVPTITKGYTKCACKKITAYNSAN